MTPQERIAFVDALKIKREAKRTVSRPQRLPSSVNNASAAVAGGSLFTFVGDVDPQTRVSLLNFGEDARHKPAIICYIQEDVLNSMLLAELSADAQYSRNQQTAEWYALFSGVLKTVGWKTVKFE